MDNVPPSSSRGMTKLSIASKKDYSESRQVIDQTLLLECYGNDLKMSSTYCTHTYANGSGGRAEKRRLIFRCRR